MAKFIDDIDNDEIRIIGIQVPNREQEETSAPKKRKRWPYWLIIALIAAGITTILLLWLLQAELLLPTVPLLQRAFGSRAV